MQDDMTTMAVSVKNKDRLERLKVHPAQPLNDVLSHVLDAVEQTREGSR